jgi:hypothetical protein
LSTGEGRRLRQFSRLLPGGFMHVKAGL